MIQKYIFIGIVLFLVSCKSQRTCTCSNGTKVVFEWSKNESIKACQALSDTSSTCTLD